MRKHLRKSFVSVSVILLMLLLYTVSAAAVKPSEPDLTVKRPLNMTAGTLGGKTTCYGRDLSGLTYDEAAEVIRNIGDEILRKEVSISCGKNSLKYTLENLHIKVDTEGQTKLLKDRVISGNLLERYKAARDMEREPLNLELKYEASKRDIVTQLKSVMKKWEKKMIDATVSFETGEQVVTPSRDGLKFDVKPGVTKLLDALADGTILEEGVFEIDPGAVEIPAEFTTEQASAYTILGKYTTKYPEPTTDILKNREQNLIISAGNIDGREFAPGEEISALRMYGDVTEANGYRKAATIMGGSHVDAVGGGICQTTTTLYNAALYAELEIVYRHNHSMVSNYVPVSRDAMVYYAGWDHQSYEYDFVLRNNTSDTIRIETIVNQEDTTLTVMIIGHDDRPVGRSVEYVSEILSCSPPPISNVVDPNLVNSYAPHARIYYQLGDNSPEPAMTARLWKIVYQDGKEVERTLQNAQDVYKAQASTFAVAPGVYVYAIVNPGGSYESCYIQIGVNH